MNKVTIDINCPRCRKKAIFHSTLVGTYKLYPETKGRITCGFCGLNVEHDFDNTDYYYQLTIGNRTLFARDKENLISIRNFFEQGYKDKTNKIDPELDFPKEFYSRKEEIVKKIDLLIEKERDRI